MHETAELSRLADIDTRPHATLSIYLSLDKPREGRLSVMGRMLKDKEQQVSYSGLGLDWDMLAGDLERAVRYVEELPPGPDRGLALFSCSSSGLFETYTLPVQVPDMVELGPAPYIRPLAALANEHCPSLVVVLDTRRARIFESFMGSLSEMDQMDAPTDLNVQRRGGGQGRAGDKKLSRHKKENTKLHYKDVGAKLMELFQGRRYDQLLVGGAKAAVEGLTQLLHPYLAERLGGAFSCDLNSPLANIGEAINGLQQEARRKRQERLMAKLADNLGPRGLAATGLNDVLACLHEGQVHTLFVRRGFSAKGGSCPYCGRLRHVAGDCPLCWAQMTPVADVVNLALAKALEFGADLEQIDDGSKLDDLGGIAALLRYA